MSGRPVNESSGPGNLPFFGGFFSLNEEIGLDAGLLGLGIGITTLFGYQAWKNKSPAEPMKDWAKASTCVVVAASIPLFRLQMYQLVQSPGIAAMLFATPMICQIALAKLGALCPKQRTYLTKVGTVLTKVGTLPDPLLSDELWQQVVSFCSAQDLRSLKATCRGIHNIEKEMENQRKREEIVEEILNGAPEGDLPLALMAKLDPFRLGRIACQIKLEPSEQFNILFEVAGEMIELMEKNPEGEILFGEEPLSEKEIRQRVNVLLNDLLKLENNSLELAKALHLLAKVDKPQAETVYSINEQRFSEESTKIERTIPFLVSWNQAGVQRLHLDWTPEIIYNIAGASFVPLEVKKALVSRFGPGFPIDSRIRSLAYTDLKSAKSLYLRHLWDIQDHQKTVITIAGQMGKTDVQEAQSFVQLLFPLDWPKGYAEILKHLPYDRLDEALSLSRKIPNGRMLAEALLYFALRDPEQYKRRTQRIFSQFTTHLYAGRSTINRERLEGKRREE